MTYEKNNNVIRMPRFEDIKVGDVVQLKHLLTQKDVETFAALTGDFNPLHVDEEFAKRTLFQKPVVHGMLSASFISTMIGMGLPGAGALWMSQTLEFLSPAHIGDTLCVVATVKQKSDALRVLLLKILICNQRGQELIKGESSIKVLELKSEEKDMDANKGKTVLITGAGGGIGGATALKLAQAGHTVVLNYHSASGPVEEIVKQIQAGGGKAISFKGDITQAEEAEKLFATSEKSFGPIHAVVHCASPDNTPQPFDKLDWKAFQEQLDVNVKGAFHCVRAALPKMLAVKSGDLIFVGTVYTDGVPPPQQSRYIVAKSALTSLARCLAVEYGPSDIRVNVVAPGMTQTGMIADLPDKVKMLTKMQTPLRRLAEADDVAQTIVFLLSPGARHITGQTIRVCGGSVMA